jgi:putative hydrolase of the HAD superfamily
MRRLEMQPDDCLFVGDGGSGELEGARRSGMQAVMITGIISEIWPERIESRSKQADFVITSLSELLVETP